MRVILCGLISALIILLGSCEEKERQPSMFKVGDDWMALPEVFSNLDFAADNTPASEEDIAGQLRLRTSRFWGRIYIDGWPQSIQYFRAHFGTEPPLGRVRFVFSEPRDACQDLTNADLLTEHHVVLANRGNCTFGTKAKFAQKTRAKAIIILNNEAGLDHLPGPDAHDIQFSVVSIAQPEGQLLEAVYDEGPSVGGFGRELEGYMVPINCESSGANCLPATFEERNYVKNIVDGGILRLESSPSDESIEYLLAHFGTKVLDESISLEVVAARPPEACSPLDNDVKGKIVLVRRGSCNFLKKAEEVQAAGGRAVIIGSLYPYLVRMGVEPRWKGLSISIPVVMVSSRAYGALVAEAHAGSRIGFRELSTVNNTVWEPLERLSNGEGWPRSEAYVQKKYDELVESHQRWPDRLETVQKAHVKYFGSKDKVSSNEKSEL